MTEVDVTNPRSNRSSIRDVIVAGDGLTLASG